MAEIILKTENLKAGYGHDIILPNINIEIKQDDFIAVIGPNGGGKTTLLKTILGLLSPLGGKVRYFENGKEVKQLKIGYLPQYHSVDKQFPITVFDVIHSGFIHTNLFNFRLKKSEKKAIYEVAEKLGVETYLNSPIGNLSGGQLQKVFLGRAIIDNPRLLVLDEPNTYVDSQFESELYKLLKELNNDMAILMVSHDLGTVFSNVKSIACVNRNYVYHPTNELNQEIIDTYNCPIDVVTHGHIPHRVLPEHKKFQA